VLGDILPILFNYIFTAKKVARHRPHPLGAQKIIAAKAHFHALMATVFSELQSWRCVSASAI
jgi:hypothetical protein